MSTRKLCSIALLIALTCVATLIIRIPIPGTGGYVNFGDSILLIAGVFFGPAAGFCAGGIGSALADVIGGYITFAPFTFVIKGIEGLVAALIAGSYIKNPTIIRANVIIGNIVSVIIMIVGYYFVDVFLAKNFAAGLASIPGNTIQAVGSLIIFFIIGFAISKTGINGFIKKLGGK